MNLDLTYLEDITGGDKEMILEMLELFIEDIPGLIESILDCSQAGDLKKLGAEAHKTKPTLQYVGFHEMHDTVKKIEELAKAGSYTDEIPELSGQLKKSMDDNFPLLIKTRDEIKQSL